MAKFRLRYSLRIERLFFSVNPHGGNRTYKLLNQLNTIAAAVSSSCLAEIPNIKEAWDKHHDDGFEVIVISVDEDSKALKSFVAEEKPPWTVVADNNPQNQKSMGGKYGIRSIPAFVLIGRDGQSGGDPLPRPTPGTNGRQTNRKKLTRQVFYAKWSLR